MKRFKLFMSNLIVYGLGGVMSGIIPFIMLPVITRLLPDTEYFGLNDLTLVIVSFGSAIAIMGMYDAMFRMFFEYESNEYKREICSTTLLFTFCTTIIVVLVLIVFGEFLSKLFFGSTKYMTLLYIAALNILTGATNAIVSAPTRFLNERKIFIITNTCIPILSYAISIPLLLQGYYVIALPLGAMITSFCIECVFIIRNRKWFSLSCVNYVQLKPLLYIALPLLPNFLVYWIYNSADKLMIAQIIGNDSAGVYAVGAKIGQISQLVYTAFAGGWQYFAFSTMKEKDQVEMTSRILEYLTAITIMISMIMIAGNELIFRLLFVGDYIKGSSVAPYLFMAPLLLMLYQVACNQYIVIKKTLANVFILSIGAIVNLALNYYLIQHMGIEGAGIATFMGYIVSVGIAVLHLRKIKLLKLSRRFVFLVAMGIGYLVMWRMVFYDQLVLIGVISVVGIIIIMGIYIKDIFRLVHKE